MKKLTTVLKEDLSKELNRLHQERRSIEMSLLALSCLNPDNADYTIEIKSLWGDHGEEDTETKYRGNLQEAVRMAEEEFKKSNKRSDLQAKISVSVRLGKRNYEIPKEYWEKYSTK